MPRGARRIIHWGPGGEGDGLAWGVGGGYYSTDPAKTTCPFCIGALAVEDFNRANPVGTLVRYWPATLRGKARDSTTRSAAWRLGDGSAVVSVEGYSGGIALTHIHVLEAAAAQSQVLLEGDPKVKTVVQSRATGSFTIPVPKDARTGKFAPSSPDLVCISGEGCTAEHPCAECRTGE